MVQNEKALVNLAVQISEQLKNSKLISLNNIVPRDQQMFISRQSTKTKTYPNSNIRFFTNLDSTKDEPKVDPCREDFSHFLVRRIQDDMNTHFKRLLPGVKKQITNSFSQAILQQFHGQKVLQVLTQENNNNNDLINNQNQNEMHTLYQGLLQQQYMTPNFI